jgi:hypothetical protein
MHSVLFVASIPVVDVMNPHPGRALWGRFTTDVDAKTATDLSVLRLAENVWLVDTTKALSSLAWLISFAEVQTVSYGLVPFEHAPVWLPDGFDPKTIQAQKV